MKISKWHIISDQDYEKLSRSLTLLKSENEGLRVDAEYGRTSKERLSQELTESKVRCADLKRKVLLYENIIRDIKKALSELA